jgi:hypothetical protein
MEIVLDGAQKARGDCKPFLIASPNSLDFPLLLLIQTF